MCRVCVLLSSFNGEHYIEEQIDSIFNQKNVDLTLVVRDDSSSDGTMNVLCSLKDKYKDKMFIYSGKNVGFSRSFYTLVLNSSDDFDYYAFADQDDVWLPEKIEKCINKLQDQAKPEVCFCGCFLTDKNLNIIKKGDSSPHLDDKYYNALRNYAQGCSMVFNKKAKELFLKGDANMIEYHDHWMMTICSFLGSVYFADEPLFYYRQHGGNEVGSVTSFKTNFTHRLKVLKKKTHHIETNAKQMLCLFSDFLGDDEKVFFTLLASYRNNIFRKTKVYFSRIIKHHCYEHYRWFERAVLFNKL